MKRIFQVEFNKWLECIWNGHMWEKLGYVTEPNLPAYRAHRYPGDWYRGIAE